MVAQYSDGHPAVRQALVALGSAFEAYERKSDQDSENNVELAELNRQTLRHYNEALKKLVQYLASTDHDLTVIIMSCLIFTWIEVM